VGLNQWLRLFDMAANLAQFAGRARKPDAPADAMGPAGGAGGGPLAQLETRLAGVVVAALKEAFDRDRARMDLEKEHLDAERRRAEQALRAELRRQAADIALGQMRTAAIMAVGVWMLSAALGVWMPGMREGSARFVLGAGWGCALASLACAFAGWQRIAAWSASDHGESATAGPGFPERAAPWLLIAAIAFVGAALLLAL
jgi:hypothetical protein